MAVPGNGDAAVLHPTVDFVKRRTYETELSFKVVDLALKFQLNQDCQPILDMQYVGCLSNGRRYLSLFADGLFGTVSLLPVLDLLP